MDPRRACELGADGPISSRPGLGTYGLSGAYGSVDRSDAARLFWRAVDGGVTHFDTCATYGDGAVERLFGELVPAVRDEVLLATRAGRTPGGPGDARAAREAVVGSLRRLRTEWIDVYYVECPSPRLEDDVHALAELVKEGKIRYIGLRDPGAGELRRARAVWPVTVVSCAYSLWCRAPERELIPAARELDVGVVACAPLGRGLCTGLITRPEDLAPGDRRRSDPWFSCCGLARAAPGLRRMDEIASRLNLGRARLTLAWLLAQGDDIVPMPSTRDPMHLEMNLEAPARLPQEALDALTDVFPPAAGSGPPASPASGCP